MTLPTHLQRQNGILSIDRPIVLVGMMGSGKSTIGRRLALRLGLPFCDADEEIERAAGLSITELFAKYGEPHFRDGERRVINRLLQRGPSVLATGGGAFVQPDTRNAILQHGMAVWLDVPVATLVERTSRRNTRPLLLTGDPSETLSQLLEQRRPCYALAPIHIISDATPHSRAVDAIITALKDYRS
ncbi:MAG: shikimate kinase [Sphingopyxis sp.]